MIDRRLLFHTDIQSSCPEPCQACDYKGAHGFSFRCLLRRKDKNREPDIPERHGVTCSAPRYRLFRWFPFKIYCKVADWKEEALQHVHISAMLSCATATIVQGLHRGWTADERQEFHRSCIEQELGNDDIREDVALPTEDDAISPDLKLVFGHVIGLGMASGLAGLRQATRVGMAGTATAFWAAFSQHLPGSLEWHDSDVTMYASSELLDKG